MVLIAGVVLWLVLNWTPYLGALKAKLEERRIKNYAYNTFEKPYLEDKYGGKTPEETYDLLISALENGDTTLASKYFVVEKQDDWKKTFEEYKKVGSVKDFVAELKETMTKWKKIETREENLAEYGYEVIVEKDTTVRVTGNDIELLAGKYKNIVMFQKYPSGVWKIDVL